MNWLEGADVTIIQDGLEFNGSVDACPHCEHSVIMSVTERKCGKCGEPESTHQLTNPNLRHLFERTVMNPLTAKDCNQMLRVELPDKTIGIQFRHRFGESILNGIKSKSRMTHCGIYDISGLKPEDKPVKISSGMARCSDKDQFNREVGRKISLTRALLEGDHFLSQKTFEAKVLREFVWLAYRGRIPSNNSPSGVPAIEGEIINQVKQLPPVPDIHDLVVDEETPVH